MSVDPTSISHYSAGKSVTSQMQYGLKPSAPQSRSFRTNIAPSNKAVFSPQDTMIFDIPTGQPGTYLDQSQSFLKFTVQCITTAQSLAQYGGTGVFLDNTAYSFLNRLDIYHSSNLLETISQYGQLCNYSIDTQLSMSDKAGLSSMIGSNPFTYAYNSAGAFAQNGAVALASQAGDRSGMAIATNTTYATTTPYTFCLPILSGVIGVNSSKMLPLGLLNSSAINVQFILSSNDDAIYYGTAGAGATWQIVNAELVCQFVQIEDKDFNRKMLPGEVEYISTHTYRQTTANIPQGISGSLDLLVGIRAASLTQLIARFRNQSGAIQGVNASAAYRLSSSVNPNIANYQWRVGSDIFPRKAVSLQNGQLASGGSEGCAEVNKSWHALGTMICNGSINTQQYNVAHSAQGAWLAPWPAGAKNTPAAYGLDTSNNAFSIATELSVFANRDDTILSGISTLNSNLFLSLNFYNATQSSTVVDVFAQMDMILVIENGALSAKY